MERRLAAILAADVVGYSRLMEIDEVGTLAALKAYRQDVVDPLIARHGGRIVKLMGDGMLVEFPSVVDAVACAMAIQQAMAEKNAAVAEAVRVVFRIGVNLGDIIIEGDDIYGDGVNLAARLEGLADPGGICISRAVRDQVRDKLDCVWEDLGEVEVKNIARPLRVFRIAAEGRAGAAPKRRPSRRRRWQPIAALLLLLPLLGGIAWLQGWLPVPGTTSEPPVALVLPNKPSVAVLPFTNLEQNAGQDYFADGLTVDLITDLSKVSGLFVIARNSSFAYKGRQVEVRRVAAEMGVRYVLEGSVRRAGDQVRINTQLIDATTGGPVWAERYDRRIADVFAVQDDLVGRIVSALAVQLTRSEENSLAQRPAPKFEAYDLYLQAREGYFSRDQERMRESLDLYARAWEIDPSFAKAYAGYAQVAADIWRISALREAMGGVVARESAEVAARKALSIDPTLADAYSVLAVLRMVDKDYEDAIALATRAVDLEPNSAEAYTALAIVLAYAGRPEAALEAMRTSIRLNPKPAPYHLTYYGLALFLNRLYEEAVEVLLPIADTRDRGLGDAPREILAMAYAQLDRRQDAEAQVQEMLQAEPYLNLAYYRVVYDHHGRGEDLELRLDALEKAGLPPWPFDVRGDPAERLAAAELQALIAGTTWSGRDLGRDAFIQEFGPGDSSVYAGPGTLLNGTAFVADEVLCERYEGFMLGRDLCGPVFRNPEGTPEEENDFTYVNSATAKILSVTR